MDALERIAAALERIADALETKREEKRIADEGTPFPWRELSYRVNNVADANMIDGKLATTEQLIQIGRKALCLGRWRNLGSRTIIKEIDPTMKRLGFWEQWSKS